MWQAQQRGHFPGRHSHGSPPGAEESYKILYKRGLSLSDAIATMEQELDSYEEVEHFMRFLRTVERGICRASAHGIRE